MKKIGIYNPYLETKGGGEKVCLAMASALSSSPDYKVELITHKEVDIRKLADYFNIDLSRVQVMFINFETLPIRLLSHLPLPGRLKHFFLDIKAFRTIKRRRYDIFVNNCYQSDLPNPSPIGVYMCMFPQKLAKSRQLGLVKKVYYLVVDMLYRIFLHPAHQNGIYSYQAVTANSEYTRGYIMKYWNRDAEVIYPICEDMDARNSKKEKIILNVGRFFENSGENHHKRQDFLLKAFSDMKKLHEQGWELHFAGSTAEDVGALKYILDLIKAAENLPVTFHFNASFNELKRLYNRASLYWHATGYGSDPAKHPEKQEHFGIVTVEAMSAGCIPVVIDAAGQKESVVQKKNGYLWNSSKELKTFTITAARLDEATRQAMVNEARATAKRYDKASFNQRVLDFFANL